MQSITTFDNISDSSCNVMVDGEAYFGQDSIFYQSGSADFEIDSKSISISLDVYNRINSASDLAQENGKPIPQSLSKSTSWLASRYLAKNDKTPTFVNAIFDGGIMLEYYLENDLYIMLEFFDDGDIVCLLKKNGIRKSYQLTSGTEIKPLLQPILDGGSLQ